MRRGAPALKSGGDAAGVFLQSVWWNSQYPSWKVLRGFLAPNIGGEAFRGVFAIYLVTLTLPRLEGAKRLPGAQHWGGCCRGVFVIGPVTVTLPQLEGATTRPRAQNWEGLL